MRALAKNKVYFLLQVQSKIHTEPTVWTAEMYSMSAQIGSKNIGSISIKSDLNSLTLRLHIMNNLWTIHSLTVAIGIDLIDLTFL